jgi:hypothetical protein
MIQSLAKRIRQRAEWERRNNTISGAKPSNVLIARTKRVLLDGGWQRCAVCHQWWRYEQMALVAVAEQYTKSKRILHSEAYCVCDQCVAHFLMCESLQSRVFDDLLGDAEKYLPKGKRR